jgi:hypothetical protein
MSCGSYYHYTVWRGSQGWENVYGVFWLGEARRMVELDLWKQWLFYGLSVLLFYHVLHNSILIHCFLKFWSLVWRSNQGLWVVIILSLAIDSHLWDVSELWGLLEQPVIFCHEPTYCYTQHIPGSSVSPHRNQAIEIKEVNSITWLHPDVSIELWTKHLKRSSMYH